MENTAGCLQRRASVFPIGGQERMSALGVGKGRSIRGAYMSFKPVHFAAAVLCCWGTAALAQTGGSPGGAAGSAPAAGNAPAAATTPSLFGGVGPAAPTPGQSTTVGPVPAPTPGQSVSGPSRTNTTADPVDNTRPAQSRQSRMRNARTPKQPPTTVGSGSSARPESPSRPERFQTPNILHEPGSGRKQEAVDTPSLSPTTGRPAAAAPR
jgi:hypothetical protein